MLNYKLISFLTLLTAVIVSQIESSPGRKKQAQESLAVKYIYCQTWWPELNSDFVSDPVNRNYVLKSINDMCIVEPEEIHSSIRTFIMISLSFEH